MIDRRQFLVAVGGASGAALVASACSSGGGNGPTAVSQPAVTRADHLEGDLAIASLLASIENLLTAVYQTGIDRADRYGPYSPAVASLLSGAQAQHKDHATAWNSILTGAGKPGVTGVDLSVKSQTTDPPLNRARDVTGLLGVVSDLENLAATTYLAAIGALDNIAAVKVAASIHPVEHEHVGAITFLLGKNLGTDSFTHADGARTTTDSIG